MAETSFDAVSGSLNSKSIYSTTEQVIGKWIDGKPLYRKVFTSQGATGIPFDTIVSIKGMMTNTSRYWDPLPQSWASGYGAVWIDKNDNSIVFSYDVNSLAMQFVIIEYTKTSD